MKPSKCLPPLMLAAALMAVAPPPLAGAHCSDPANCFVLRAPSGAAVAAIVQAHGLTFVDDAHDNVPGVVLAEGPPGVPVATTLQGLLADPRVLGAEPARLASLSEDDAASVLAAVSLSGLSALGQSGLDGGPAAALFAAGAWNGYLNQPAALAVRLPETRALPQVEALGTGVVAVIDTGVDPDHPLLQGALVTGFDFLTNQLGVPSEWDALDPASVTATEDDLRAVAEQSYGAIVEGLGGTVAEGAGLEIVVDQSYGAIVEGLELPAAFGHGTMAAGIVRLVAPGARIMPLRAFDGDGTASLFDVVRATYFANFAGADVINMSFSLDQHSEILATAVNLAKLLGVVCVSSTGNHGSAAATYPAALGNVIGVASTDALGQLSEFSNHGLGLATLAAPGEAIVTLYPGGHYAGAWGTSFAAAFAAGTAALLNEWRTIFGVPILFTANFALAELALESSADNPTGATDWDTGRLDARGAFDYGLAGN